MKRTTQGILHPLLQHASVSKPTIGREAVEEFVSTWRSSGQILANFHSLADAIVVLEDFAPLPKKVMDELGKLEKHVAAPVVRLLIL